MHHDEELAAYTDALRRGAAPEEIGGDDMSDLAMVLRGLHSIMPPDQEAPPMFRAELGRLLADEFDQQKRSQSVIPMFQRGWVRVASLAAALTLLIGIVVILQGDSNGSITGTASGSSDPSLLIIGVLVAMFAAAAAFVFWQQRNK